MKRHGCAFNARGTVAIKYRKRMDCALVLLCKWYNELLVKHRVNF